MVVQHIRSEATNPTQALLELLEQRRGERHMVAIRGYPDPDSIGSAMAHAFMARRFGIETLILYFDDISHQENRALVKQLNIEMVRYNDKLNLQQYQRVALVDTQHVELPPRVQSLPVLTVVDHHKQQADVEADFVDVREDSGSTCSIYAEYMEQGIGALDREDPEISKLCSAMLYGIRSDTDDYLLAREIDYRAAAYLAPYADHDLLHEISQQSISPRAMEITQKAFANKVISDTFLIAGVGYVRDEDRDAIGQAADYLLRREGIDTVLCYGIVNNQYVDGSLRTISNVVDPDHFLRDLLGVDNNEQPYGGGRADKGAFKVPLGPFAHCGDRELLWQMVQRTVEDLFLNKVGGAESAAIKVLPTPAKT